MATGLSAAHIGELVRELTPFVEGCRVRELVALPPRDLLLILEPPGEPGPILRLRLAAGPVGARLHLQIGRVRRPSGPPGPFFRQVLDRFTGLEITRLAQVEGDRVVRLDATGEAGELSLVAELLGRHGNLVLLDGGGRVIAILVPARGRQADAPRLVIGEPYRLPPGRSSSPAAGPALVESLPDPAPGEGLAARAPRSWRVECSLGAEAEASRGDEHRRDLVRRLERRRKAARSLLRGLETRERACAEAERIRQDGELLKTELSRLRRGLREVEVADWFVDGAPPRRIPLEPRLSPKDNVERFFARYRKLLRSAEKLPGEIELARARAEDIDDLLQRLHDPATDPLALEEEAIAGGWLKPRQEADVRRRTAPPPRLPYLRFTGRAGSEIRVGRTARDNDRLTFREARGNDLWFHTSDAPGSHVVLRLERGREPDPEEVLDAAHLAIHFSPLRGARKAEVHEARVKHVKKPRRAPPGLVTLSGGRTRLVRVEEDRLARLLDPRRGVDRGPSGTGA